MNRVKTCVQYKCMGLYENLTSIIFLNSNVHLRNEGAHGFAGNWFWSIFGAILRKFQFQFSVLQFHKTKWFVVYLNIFGSFQCSFSFLILFCVVFIRISVPFCGVAIPLMLPSEMIDCSQNSLEYLTSLTIQSNYKE